VFDLEGKKVTVLGLGTRGSGVGAVRFLVERGAEVLVSDLKGAGELPSLKEIEDLPVRLSLGGHYPEIFEADLLVRAPAVPHTSEVLKEAERRGIPVLMESTLFFSFCSSTRVIGITGTKGKTTATLLLERILRGAGKDVVAAGNFGRSMLEVLPRINAETWVVLELSSFQLEGLPAGGRGPHVALVTSFFPDHLDRYRDLAEYAAAKSLIFRYQKEGDLLFLGKGLGGVWDVSRVKSAVVFLEEEGRELIGSVAGQLGVEVDPEVLGLPIPFRQQLVGEKDGVRFINDSCATNPGATLYGLDCFGDRVVLIMGGTDKGLGYNELVDRINEREVPVALLSGSATEKMKVSLRRELILVETVDLEEAVRVAFGATRPCGVLLFSPAAASFGLFEDEFDRGRKFDEIVKNL